MARAIGIMLTAIVALVLVGLLWWWLNANSAPGSLGPGPNGPETEGEHPAVPSDATDAVIEHVHDGDTLFLADGTKVRLLGVDTPEIGDSAECYGDEATALLRSLLPEGSTVRVLPDVQPLDQYGRSLLLLWTSDGTFVNLALIEAGAAEAVVLRPNLAYADEFEAAEDEAQAAGAGMWSACG